MRFSLLLISTLLPAGAIAQVLCTLGSATSPYSGSADQRPTPDAMELARRVNGAMGSICSPQCPQIAVFRNATAANAMLIVARDQAKIVYAPQFFDTIYDRYGDGAIIAIMAHLFGHALDETVRVGWVKSAWPPEVRADAWAGCALAKAALSPSDLKEALIALAKYPSPSHPAWALRLPALRVGYTQCGGDGARF